ncbi:MAG: TMEM175 family protein [Methanoregula sp.]
MKQDDAVSAGTGSSGSGVTGFIPKDMLEILVNGVFAFAMTLIVRNNFQIPASIITDEVTYFAAYTGSIINNGISFFFLFLIIAVFYILFFEIMGHNQVIDRGTVVFTFAFLLSILFIPLTSLLYALSEEPVPYGVIFHANVFISGILIYLLWRYISKAPVLCVPGIDVWTTRNLSLRLLLLPATAVVGFCLDSWEGSFSKVPAMVLYLIPVILFVYLSRDPQVSAEPEPADEKTETTEP